MIRFVHLFFVAVIQTDWNWKKKNSLNTGANSAYTGQPMLHQLHPLRWHVKLCKSATQSERHEQKVIISLVKHMKQMF